ncbi:MAG TPA: biosynthetic peptidoglycan transglycosylase, partial [Ktedonobacteraceae bacterium]
MSTDGPQPENDEKPYRPELPSPEPEHSHKEQVANITPRVPPTDENEDEGNEPTLKLLPLHQKKPTSPSVSQTNGAFPPQPEQPALQIEDYKYEGKQAYPLEPAPIQQPRQLPVIAVPSRTTREHELLRQRKYRYFYLRHLAWKRFRRAREANKRQVHRVWVAMTSVTLALLALMITLTSAGSYIVYSFYNQTQNQYAGQMISLRDLVPKDNLKIYDSQGILLTELAGDGLHTSVSQKQIPKYAMDATVSTEDKNFWTNSGVDIARIFQAAYDDLRNGQAIEGGSTITQQLIKNLVVGNQTTLQRKMQEVALTPIINQHYTKSDILEMYLNTIYYGEQAYGIDAAARVYYGLQDSPNHPAASQLDLAQSAMLAGIINSPIANDPWLYPQVAYTRFDYVITRMQEDGSISKPQALNAAREAHSPNFFKHIAIPNRAPHFTNFVINQLEQSLHLT